MLQPADQAPTPTPDLARDPIPSLPANLPEPFADLVRDALLHLYDPAQLQAHPLVAIAAGSQPESVVSGASMGGRVLRQALLDALDALQPGPGVAATSRPWRAYRILELRYLEAMDVADVIGQVALSKSQYHREHQRALHGVAAVLWERWRLDGRWATLAMPRSPRLGDDLARIEAATLRAGAANTGARQIDTAEVVQSASRVIEPLCAARGIELRLALLDGATPLAGDRVALRQALLTILGHAATTLERGPLMVVATSEPGRVVLQVSGPSAPGLNAARLGMVESRPFVEALGGTAAYRSARTPDGRWTIALEFPAIEPPLLLVVDNNDDFRRLVERFLAGSRWAMVGAASVDEAYALARRRRPTAILSDVVIPGRDGWELLLELKQLDATRDIPVVICSVLDEPAVAIALGAAAYVQKPIDQGQLLAVLAPFLAAPARGSVSVG
jgi:CheY-like chemotaxis protein